MSFQPQTQLTRGSVIVYTVATRTFQLLRTFLRTCFRTCFRTSLLRHQIGPMPQTVTITSHPHGIVDTRTFLRTCFRKSLLRHQIGHVPQTATIPIVAQNQCYCSADEYHNKYDIQFFHVFFHVVHIPRSALRGQIRNAKNSTAIRENV